DRIARADSSLGFSSLAAAAPAVSIWDPAALMQALLRSRRDAGIPAGVGWQLSPRGLLAVIPERPSAAGAQGRAPWTVVRLLASAADLRGEPIPVSSSGEDSDEEPSLEPPLVSDSAGVYLVVADSTSRLPAPSLGDALSRLAHAWDLQNFRLLFGELPQPNPRIVTRRDARERLRLLAPFFTQGSIIHPLVWADTLYWSVELFATSTTYPLSDRDTLAGQDWSYVHHAATGLVNAQSGQVTLVGDSPTEPVAESWMRRFPALFTHRGGLPPALSGAIPPSVDAARIMAAAFARVGSRDQVLSRGHIPWNDGADTLFLRDAQPVFLLPARDSALAWTVPVLDENDHVLGLLIATGGEEPTTYWLAVDTRQTRWSAVVDQLHQLPDTPAVLPRDTRAARGAVRALPVAGEVAYAQPTYAWRAGAAPSLVRVNVLAGGSVAGGRTLAAASTTPPAGAAARTPPSPQSFRARVGALYEDMRAALRRGDWSAFGRAYDALGELLRASPP
ncbi:MAG: UPF0182 family protein, partial [Chloroflexota bacterium]|nr:UPF0182 family protein [Chloroflexota bacterium]